MTVARACHPPTQGFCADWKATGGLLSTLIKRRGPPRSNEAALLANKLPGGVLLSRGSTPQVPSALTGLTSVFGMGTGGSPSLSPPDSISKLCGLPRGGRLRL